MECPWYTTEIGKSSIYLVWTRVRYILKLLDYELCTKSPRWSLTYM